MLFQRKARSVSPDSISLMAEAIVGDANGLFDVPLTIFFTELEGDSKLGKSGLVEECLFFLLHCFDRVSVSSLNAQFRAQFMDCLVASTLGAYLKMKEVSFGQRWNDFDQERLFQRALSAHLEYANLKINLKRTDLSTDVFWQFANRLSTMAEIYDVTIIMRLSAFAFSLFELANEMMTLSTPKS